MYKRLSTITFYSQSHKNVSVFTYLQCETEHSLLLVLLESQNLKIVL